MWSKSLKSLRKKIHSHMPLLCLFSLCLKCYPKSPKAGRALPGVAGLSQTKWRELQAWSYQKNFLCDLPFLGNEKETKQLLTCYQLFYIIISGKEYLSLQQGQPLQLQKAFREQAEHPLGADITPPLRWWTCLKRQKKKGFETKGTHQLIARSLRAGMCMSCLRSDKCFIR